MLKLLYSFSQVLGGTSVLNFMVYGRGSPPDFDEWESRGNPGWGYRDVLPYFKKSEDVQVDALRDSPYHGHGGPLSVQESPWRSVMAPAFMQVMRTHQHLPLGWLARGKSLTERLGAKFQTLGNFNHGMLGIRLNLSATAIKPRRFFFKF